MIRRLKIKFVCINMLIVTVMLAVIFGMVLTMTGRKTQEEGLRIMQSLHENVPHRGPAIADRRVPYFMVTISPEGDIAVSERSFFEQAPDSDFLEIARAVSQQKEMQGELKDHNLRFSRRPVPAGEEIVFLDTSMENGMLKDLLKTCVSISIVSYVLFFGVSVLLAQWAIRPVETAWNQQRQFVADASHELKTPLTVIMTNTELLQDDSYDPESRARFVLSIQTMSQQMRGLVEGLLSLARIDSGVIKSSFEELDLSALMAESALVFEVLLFEKGLELKTQIEENIRLKGSEAHLRQIAEILLDNAGKYGAPESTVEVTLKRQGRVAQLCVSTAGAEISRHDLKNIFRRFYRIDQARAMNHSYGLGLSIAEGIVREHGGKIWAESHSGRNDFHVQLPINL